LPQGFAKKIQFNLLLTDFALQLGYPAPRSVFIGVVLGLCCRHRNGPWTARRGQRRRPSGLVLRMPLVEKFATYPQLSR